MARIQSSRIWNGLKVDEYTNTETAEIQLRQSSTSGEGDLLAKSFNSDWELVDTNKFVRLYNNRARYSEQLTTTQFEKEFFNNGRPLFNEDRALVLNNVDNYGGLTLADNNRTQFFNNGVPGLQNPTTGQVVNNDGTVTGQNPFGQTPGFLANGTPTQYGTFAFPNDQLTIGSQDSNPDIEGVAVPKGRSLRTGSSAGIMRYPLNDMSQFGVDYIQITGHKYSARGDKKGSLTGGKAEDRVGPLTGTVQLPIQKNISESFGVDFSEDKLNFIQASLADTALTGIDKISNLDIFGAAGAMAEEAGKMIEKGFADPNTKYFLRAYFAGKAVGANLIARSTGSVLNPNLELLFNGPRLRNFKYSFELTPRDPDEARVIQKIIKWFKYNAAPSKSGTNGIFLYTPNVFKLKFIFNNGGQHPYLHKFKPCFLKNIAVDYTPANQYMTYPDGSMTSYVLRLDFGELEPIYQDDNEDSTQDMGY